MTEPSKPSEPALRAARRICDKYRLQDFELPIAAIIDQSHQALWEELRQAYEALVGLYPHIHEDGMEGESGFERAWLKAEAVLENRGSKVDVPSAAPPPKSPTHEQVLDLIHRDTAPPQPATPEKCEKCNHGYHSGLCGRTDAFTPSGCHCTYYPEIHKSPAPAVPSATTPHSEGESRPLRCPTCGGEDKPKSIYKGWGDECYLRNYFACNNPWHLAKQPGFASAAPAPQLAEEFYAYSWLADCREPFCDEDIEVGTKFAEAYHKSASRDLREQLARAEAARDFKAVGLDNWRMRAEQAEALRDELTAGIGEIEATLKSADGEDFYGSEMDTAIRQAILKAEFLLSRVETR